jgi:hypothetical protein
MCSSAEFKHPLYKPTPSELAQAPAFVLGCICGLPFVDDLLYVSPPQCFVENISLLVPKGEEPFYGVDVCYVFRLEALGDGAGQGYLSQPCSISGERRTSCQWLSLECIFC